MRRYPVAAEHSQCLPPSLEEIPAWSHGKNDFAGISNGSRRTDAGGDCETKKAESQYIEAHQIAFERNVQAGQKAWNSRRRESDAGCEHSARARPNGNSCVQPCGSKKDSRCAR